MEIQHSSSHSFISSSAPLWFSNVILACGQGAYVTISTLFNLFRKAPAGEGIQPISVSSQRPLYQYVVLSNEDEVLQEPGGKFIISTHSQNKNASLSNKRDPASQSVPKEVSFSKKKTIIHSSAKLRRAAQGAEKSLFRQPSITFLPHTGTPFLQRMKIGTLSGASLEKLDQQTRPRLEKVPAALQSVKEATTAQQFQHAKISLQSLVFLLRRVFDRISDVLISDSSRQPTARKLTAEQHEVMAERCYELESQLQEARTLLDSPFVETGTILRKLITDQLKPVEGCMTILAAAMVSGKQDLQKEYQALHVEAVALGELVHRSKKIAQACLIKIKQTGQLGDEHDTYSLLTEVIAQGVKRLEHAKMLLPNSLWVNESAVNMYTKTYMPTANSSALQAKQELKPVKRAAYQPEEVKVAPRVRFQEEIGSKSLPRRTHFRQGSAA